MVGIMCYLFPLIRRFAWLNFTNPFPLIRRFAWLNFTNPFPSIRRFAWLNFTNILHNLRINDSMVYFDFEQFSLLPLHSYGNLSVKHNSVHMSDDKSSLLWQNFIKYLQTLKSYKSTVTFNLWRLPVLLLSSYKMNSW